MTTVKYDKILGDLLENDSLLLDQTAQQDTVGAPKWDAYDFNTSATLPNAVGRLKWNATDGTIEIGLEGGTVNLQIGQETVVRVANHTHATIPNGSAVYISSAGSSKPYISLADADSYATSYVVGLTTESIDHGNEGYVTLTGLVRGLNTDGLTEGLPVWLSQSAGGWTQDRPDAPAMSVFIGYVVYAHLNHGIIAVRPVVVPRLQGLSDTYGTPDTTGQFYKWNQVTGRFELSQSEQIDRSEYLYFAQSPTADTVGDWRQYGDDNGFYIQYCSVANATKGAGTWISKFTTQV